MIKYYWRALYKFLLCNIYLQSVIYDGSMFLIIGHTSLPHHWKITTSLWNENASAQSTFFFWSWTSDETASHILYFALTAVPSPQLFWLSWFEQNISQPHFRVVGLSVDSLLRILDWRFLFIHISDFPSKLGLLLYLHTIGFFHNICLMKFSNGCWIWLRSSKVWWNVRMKVLVNCIWPSHS